MNSFKLNLKKRSCLNERNVDQWLQLPAIGWYMDFSGVWASAWFLRVGISIPLCMGLQNIPCRRVGRRSGGRGGEGNGAEKRTFCRSWQGMGREDIPKGKHNQGWSLLLSLRQDNLGAEGLAPLSQILI